MKTILFTALIILTSLIFVSCQKLDPIGNQVSINGINKLRKVTSKPTEVAWLPWHKKPATKHRGGKFPIVRSVNIDSTSSIDYSVDSLTFNHFDTTNYNWVYGVDSSSLWNEMLHCDSISITGSFIPYRVDLHQSIIYKGNVFAQLPGGSGASYYDYALILEPDSTLRWVIGESDTATQYTINHELRIGTIHCNQGNSFQCSFSFDHNLSLATITFSINGQAEQTLTWSAAFQSYNVTNTPLYLGFVDDGVFQGKIQTLQIYTSAKSTTVTPPPPDTVTRGFITTQVLLSSNPSISVSNATIQVFTSNGTLLGTMVYMPPGDPYNYYYRFVIPDISQNYIVTCLSPDSVYSQIVNGSDSTIINSNTYTVLSSNFFPSWNFNGVNVEAYPRQFFKQ